MGQYVIMRMLIVLLVDKFLSFIGPAAYSLNTAGLGDMKWLYRLIEGRYE